MGTGRAKKPADAGVGGGRPCSEGDGYTSRWPRGVPVASETDSYAITWAGPVLARFLLKSHRLTDPIWDKSGVYPLGVTAGAGERREVRSWVDGDRGGMEWRCSPTTHCCLLDGTVFPVDGGSVAKETRHAESQSEVIA